MEKSRKPKIRFKGYNDDWEQRKLGDCIFELKSGLSRMLSEEDIGMPVVRANNIENDKLDMSNNVKYWYVNDPQGVDTLNYTISKNDILINFINSENKMGTAAIVEKMPNRPTIYTTNILKMKLNDKCYNYYFLAYTHTKDYKEYIKGISKIAVNQASFTTVDFKNYCINIPSVNEQSAIGECFRKIDELITLHQRKLEKLMNVKKSMLEKMFPKQGSVVPEIRFCGFTDAWEQRKLEEIVQITMGQSPDGSTYSNEPSDYILIQGNADLLNGWVSPRIWTTQITKKADAGDLIMSVRAPAGSMGKTAYDAVIGRGVAAIKGNEFIYQLLVKMDEVGYWKTFSCGSTFESLSSDTIKNAKVNVTLIAEQTQIGLFLNQLDSLITLHQRKLEKLKNIKKSMLEKMFI